MRGNEYYSRIKNAKGETWTPKGLNIFGEPGEGMKTCGRRQGGVKTEGRSLRTAAT